MDDEHTQETFDSNFRAETQPPPVRQPGAEAVSREKPVAAEPTDLAELLGVLRRIERTLVEVRGQFETLTRDQRHREFSPARLIGALLQALVLFFVIAGLADWVYQAELGQPLIKLLFAGVFQLGALTAFVLSRNRA